MAFTTSPFSTFRLSNAFVRDSADSVKHKYQQDVKLLFQRKFFDCLKFVSRLGSDFVTGYTVLLFFVYDVPSHAVCKLVASLALHGNVSFVVGIIIYLLPGRNTVQAANSFGH